MEKQAKFFPAKTNIPDAINKALHKHVTPSTNLDISTSTVPPSTTFMQQPPPSRVLQTVNPNVCTNSFSYPTDKLVTEISNLLRPHVQISLNTDPFVIVDRAFQNLLQLHWTNI